MNSLKTYTRAEKESGQDIGFHRTGSLRLASTPEELAAYESLVPGYSMLNIPYSIVKADEIYAIHPMINLEGVLGAAYTPDDGHVDPTGTTMALAACSRQRGATILRQHQVDAITATPDNLWQVKAQGKTFNTDRVIIATSFWAREMLLKMGIDLPLYALEHHEIVTEAHPEVAQLDFELPTVRDPVIPGNVRQERDGFLIGVYEKNPVAWNPGGIPPEFGQELLIPDMERLTDHLEKSMWRFPALGEVGIKVANNGPLCFAPDGMPVLGPVQSQPGLWVASGFHVGIGTGGGAGQFISEWIASGTPPYDIPVICPERFDKPMPVDDAVAGCLELYAAGYATPAPAQSI